MFLPPFSPIACPDMTSVLELENWRFDFAGYLAGRAVFSAP